MTRQRFYFQVKRKEVDDLRVRSSEAESKVAELTVRLENQTLEVLRLQTELEEYEYECWNVDME